MNSAVLVTAPATEPVTLTEIKAQLRIDDSDSDTLLTTYGKMARQFIEDSELDRALITQTWDLKLKEFAPRIILPRPPVQSITSITYVDTDGDTQTLDSSKYTLVGANAHGPASVVEAYGQSWPSVRDIEEAVTIRFVAGYGSAASSVPEAIRHAILMTVAHFYRHREPVNVGNIVTPIPMTIQALLAPYRNVRFL